MEAFFSSKLPHEPQVIIASNKPEYSPFKPSSAIKHISAAARYTSDLDLILLHFDVISGMSFNLAKECTVAAYAKEIATDLYFHAHNLIGRDVKLYSEYLGKMPPSLNAQEQLVYILLPRIRMEAVGFFAQHSLPGKGQEEVDVKNIVWCINSYQFFRQELDKVVKTLLDEECRVFLSSVTGKLWAYYLIITRQEFELLRHPFTTTLQDVSRFMKTMDSWEHAYEKVGEMLV